MNACLVISSGGQKDNRTTHMNSLSCVCIYNGESKCTTVQLYTQRCLNVQRKPTEINENIRKSTRPLIVGKLSFVVQDLHLHSNLRSTACIVVHAKCFRAPAHVTFAVCRLYECSPLPSCTAKSVSPWAHTRYIPTD